MQAATGAGKRMGNTLATAGAANDSILDGEEAALLHTSDKLKTNRMEMLGGSNSYAGKLQTKADAGEQLLGMMLKMVVLLAVNHLILKD